MNELPGREGTSQQAAGTGIYSCCDSFLVPGWEVNLCLFLAFLSLGRLGGLSALLIRRPMNQKLRGYSAEDRQKAGARTERTLREKPLLYPLSSGKAAPRTLCPTQCNQAFPSKERLGMAGEA